MDAWVPFQARKHTDRELQAMQYHVEATRRPVESDLKAYRLNAAQEGRMAASLTNGPSAHRATHRSSSVPNRGKASPRGHRHDSRSPEDPDEHRNTTAHRSRANLIHAEQLLTKPKRQRSSRSLPPPRRVDPPATTDAIYRRNSKRSEESSPKANLNGGYQGATANSRRRSVLQTPAEQRAAAAAVQRSKSAPVLRRSREREGSVRSLDAPDRDKEKLIRSISDLVGELGRLGTPGTARRTGSDHGWHIVVTDLERQLEEARLHIKHLEGMREDEKTRQTKESSGVFVNQMAQMEAFYEDRVAESHREVHQIEKMNSELRREAAELRAMLQIQHTGHAAPAFESPVVVVRDHNESVAECCFVNPAPRSPSQLPSPTPPTQILPNPHHEDDSASELVPVHLSPQRPAPQGGPPQAVRLSPPHQQHGMLRATVSVMTPPPTAPSPVSPWVSRSQSAEGVGGGGGVGEPSPVSPNRFVFLNTNFQK